jgi:hypothetical protein
MPGKRPGMTLMGQRGKMKFGIFDHIDDAGIPLGQLYAERLTIAEAYDRAGFYGYHVAEHHTTPLGAAASSISSAKAASSSASAAACRCSRPPRMASTSPRPRRCTTRRSRF